MRKTYVIFLIFLLMITKTQNHNTVYGIAHAKSIDPLHKNTDFNHSLSKEMNND